MIVIKVTINLPQSVDEICDEFFDVSKWSSFKGYGPIPGIKQAVRSDTGERKDAHFSVLNTDDSSHEESVTDYVPGKSLTIRLDNFSPPLNKLATHFIETWQFTAYEKHTRVVRSFELYPRHFIAAIPLWFVSFFLKRAVKNHMGNLI
jgi:hypothetical protein